MKYFPFISGFFALLCVICFGACLVLLGFELPQKAVLAGAASTLCALLALGYRKLSKPDAWVNAER